MVDQKIQNAYRGRSVLITGGLGFIGSNLARRFVEMGGVEVHIIDSLETEQGGNLFNIYGIEDRLRLQIADVRDDHVINHVVGGIDYIFNLAGSVSHLDSVINPERDLELNCRSSLALLEACHNFNPHVKIIFTSTRQVYGRPLYLPVDEEHRVEPLDVNGINKLAAEHYHLLYHRIYGTRSVCLRLTNTYGPRQLIHHNRQGFIPWFIHQAMDGGVIELFGDGRQRRDMNYVDDVVDALLLSGASEEVEGKILNLGGAEPVTLSDLASMLIRLTGRGSVRMVPFPPERQLIDIGNFYSSYSKIETLLGWRPRTSLQTGLQQTIEFYEKHKAAYWNPNAGSLSQSRPAVQGN